MSEVTYYVALPFVFSDDGMAAGEAAECLSANSPVRGVYRTPALMDQNEIQKSGRQQNSEDHIGVEVHVLGRVLINFDLSASLRKRPRS
ncbi:hypothetical protein [Bradyrhizobium canariense]|uniref:hypothetical protein n=1 Tax=Bradyrhizobium canariense TaxID=255045 RepID=UPI001B89E7B5|nr:hypothetical protein [Bradyrhizobium canariense]MBR0950381.1 hypothetical protein [Bradyrhizobium canariense]